MPPDFSQRALPDDGAWRVHPEPAALPRLSHEGPGRKRYDDPLGEYAVRYAAKNLTGGLLERMARFRPAPEAEVLLAAVTDIEEGDIEFRDPTDGVGDWLGAQQVGRLTLTRPTRLVDVHDAGLLRGMDKHPLVRAALEESVLGRR